MSLNKLIIIGHLGKDCDVRQVNGKQVINFNVAHTEKWTSGNEQKEKTTWFNCAYWSDSRVHEYLKKGTQIYVEGAVDVRTYEANGVTKASLEVRVWDVRLLSQPKEIAPATATAPAKAYVAPTACEPIDDLPF